MAKRLWLILVLALAGCQIIPAGFSPIAWRNACAVNAVGFQDAYNADVRFKPYRWSRIITIDYGDAKRHAFCVYEYGKRILAYDCDKGGSFTLTYDLTKKEDALYLADVWAGGAMFKTAFFWEEEK